MPASKNPSSYPATFHSITRAQDSAFPYSLTLPSKKAAEQLRFRWYRFLTALRSPLFGNAHLKAGAERLELTILEKADGFFCLKFNLRDKTDLLLLMKSTFDTHLEALGLNALKTDDQLFEESLTPEELICYEREKVRNALFEKQLLEQLEHSAPLSHTDAAEEAIMAILNAPPKKPRELTPEEITKQEAWEAGAEDRKAREKLRNGLVQQITLLEKPGKIKPISPGEVEEK